MAVANAFGKVVTSGSTFMYDTGDTINSYIGEPTTNIFNRYGTSGFGAAADNAVNFDVNGNGTFIRLGYGQTFGGYTIQPNDVVYKYDLGNYGCHYHGNDVSIASGKYVTFTFDYYISPGAGGYPETNYLANMETGTGTGTGIASPNSLTGVWQTISVTTGPSTSAGNLRMLLYPGACGGRLASNGYILYKNPQVELLPHKTPFTQTSRSTTQGLLPLVSNSTIDLSSVSFDSNAQMVFDGTDDTISISSYSAIEIADNVSIECVYMRLSTDPILDIIANKYSGTGWELFCRTDNTFSLAGRNGDGTYYYTANAAYTIQNNQYYHLVAMKEGLSWRLYVNGVLYASLTAGSIGTWSNSGALQIGGEGAGYYPNMKLPVFKIYNRALSAAEVRQNYNKYKTRFNLT